MNGHRPILFTLSLEGPAVRHERIALILEEQIPTSLKTPTRCQLSTMPLNPAFATLPRNRLLSPLFATLPKTCFRKSFVCHTCDPPPPRCSLPAGFSCPLSWCPAWGKAPCGETHLECAFTKRGEGVRLSDFPISIFGFPVPDRAGIRIFLELLTVNCQLSTSSVRTPWAIQRIVSMSASIATCVAAKPLIENLSPSTSEKWKNRLMW